MRKLKRNLRNLSFFVAEKKLKLKSKKFIIGSEVEFGGSVLTAEKVKNEELIFIANKGKRIKAFEELRKPQNKYDCQLSQGCCRAYLNGILRWLWRSL